jgi:hypothetical protein
VDQNVILGKENCRKLECFLDTVFNNTLFSAFRNNQIHQYKSKFYGREQIRCISKSQENYIRRKLPSTHNSNALNLQQCCVIKQSRHKTTQTVTQRTRSHSTRKQNTIHDNVPILKEVQLSQVPYDIVTIQMTVQQCKIKPN